MRNGAAFLLLAACGSQPAPSDASMDDAPTDPDAGGDGSSDAMLDAMKPSCNDAGPKDFGCGISIPPLCNKATQFCTPQSQTICKTVPCECQRPDGATPTCACLLPFVQCPQGSSPTCTEGPGLVVECK